MEAGPADHQAPVTMLVAANYQYKAALTLLTVVRDRLMTACTLIAEKRFSLLLSELCASRSGEALQRASRLSLA